MAADAQESDRGGEAFLIRDCALIALATGTKAQNLKELRDQLLTVHPGCIYFHFWGAMLEPRFEEREYNNDFAAWARHNLHDATLAERLGVIDPTEHQDIEVLRQELIDVIEERLDENELIPWSRWDEQFEFIRSQIIVFDTQERITSPDEILDHVPRMSTSSVFYHFIDARRRTDNGVDDFRVWLAGFDSRYAELAAALADVDPYFITLAELRDELVRVLRQHLVAA